MKLGYLQPETTMQGIYLHIPFCKQACFYCDFHFSTSVEMKQEMTNMMSKELMLRTDYLPKGTSVNTIYFGGGTPSLLDDRQLSQLMETIHQHYDVASDAEITLETNPDDHEPETLERWKRAGINRLSIGIQSFDDAVLKYLNRPHDGKVAYHAAAMALDHGFENLTIDLIYGIPETQHQRWENDLQKILTLELPHVSSYCMTIEPKTVFGHRYARKQLTPAEDEFSLKEYDMLIEALQKNGYEHYEISNFAKPGFYSKHNSSYWKGASYLGIGPSAHSYNQQSRQYNIANNALYLKALAAGKLPAEREVLSKEDLFNEKIMTGLRTSWGVSQDKLFEVISSPGDDWFRQLNSYQQSGHLQVENKIIMLTDKGKRLADRIAADLFLVN